MRTIRGWHGHLAAALLAACGNVGAAALPEPGFAWTEQREYYTLTAIDLAGLQRQLETRRVEAGLADGATARTRHEMASNYQLVPSEAGCDLVQLSVSVQVTMLLPRWQPAGRPRTRVQQRWDQMLSALTRHEEGHRDNAVQAGESLYRGLSTLGPEPDCEALEQAADRVRLRVQLRLRLREHTYDQRTRHGQAEGSVL